MEKAVSLLFATPIGEFSVPESAEINPRLKQRILEREQAEPSDSKANVGGWHSRADLLEWGGDDVAAVRGWIAEAVNHMVGAGLKLAESMGRGQPPLPGKLRAQAWANVSRQGSYHRTHNHPGSAWSGVYYVEAGEPSPEAPLSGVLELADPRPYANMTATPGDPFGQKVLVRPKNGTIIVFPGWFPHFVNPYVGPGERISIAFNVSFLEGGA